MASVRYCARCQAACRHAFVPDEYEPTPGGGIRIVKRNRRNRPFWAAKNPHRRAHAVGLIPGYMTEARYYREGEHTGHYRHNFSPGTKVRMYAMSDGSVLLRGNKRIHADDRRPGFDRYTGGNPGGRRMAKKSDSSFMWYVVLGLGLFWLMSSRSAGAGVLGGGTVTGLSPSASPAPTQINAGLASTGIAQYDSGGALVGYSFASQTGGTNIYSPSGVLIGTS